MNTFWYSTSKLAQYSYKSNLTNIFSDKKHFQNLYHSVEDICQLKITKLTQIFPTKSCLFLENLCTMYAITRSSGDWFQEWDYHDFFSFCQMAKSSKYVRGNKLKLWYMFIHLLHEVKSAFFYLFNHSHSKIFSEIRLESTGAVGDFVRVLHWPQMTLPPWPHSV